MREPVYVLVQLHNDTDPFIVSCFTDYSKALEIMNNLEQNRTDASIDYRLLPAPLIRGQIDGTPSE